MVWKQGETEAEREADRHRQKETGSVLCMNIFALASLNSLEQIRHYTLMEESCEAASRTRLLRDTVYHIKFMFTNLHKISSFKEKILQAKRKDLQI